MWKVLPPRKPAFDLEAVHQAVSAPLNAKSAAAAAAEQPAAAAAGGGAPASPAPPPGMLLAVILARDAAGSDASLTAADEEELREVAIAAATRQPMSDEAHAALNQYLETDRGRKWRQAASQLAADIGLLTGLTHLDVSGFRLGESVSSLRPLTRLRSLNIESTKQSDFSLLGLLPVLTRLTELSIAGNAEVTRAPLAAVELLLPELCVLNVKRCVQIEGDQGFKEWREKHRGMTVLCTGDA